MSELLLTFVKLNAVATVAIVLVLLLRPRVRKFAGSRITYRLWVLVPLTALAVFLPARIVTTTVPAPPAARIAAPAPTPPLPAIETAQRVEPPVPAVRPVEVTGTAVAARPLLGTSELRGLLVGAVFAIWLVGFAGMFLLQWSRQRAYERSLGRLTPITDTEPPAYRAATAETGPALVGVLSPRIVLPADYDTRYTPFELDLILAHEDTHRRRGDALANAILAAIECICWFNPLVLKARTYFRLDQELACDEAVMARHPGQRRRYGETLLKDRLPGSAVPMACYWHSAHPLKQRIVMLRSAMPSRARQQAGMLATVVLGASAGAVAWAAQPPRVVEEARIEADREAVETIVAFQQGPTERFDVGALVLDDALAVVKLVPEDRTDVEISFSGPGRPTELQRHADTLYIRGHLPRNKRNCSAMDAEKASRDTDALIMTVRLPRQVNLELDGIVFANMGDTDDLSLETQGCGWLRGNAVRGNADVETHGSTAITLSNIDGEADLTAHGSTKLRVGNVGGALDAEIHGSGWFQAMNVRDDVSLEVHGSASAKLGRIGGGIDAEVHGSGSVVADAGGDGLNLSLHGSGTGEFGPVSGNLNAEVYGSGTLRIADLVGDQVLIEGQGSADILVEKGDVGEVVLEVTGSSRAKLNLAADRAMVENGSSSDQYIRKVGKLSVENQRRGVGRVRTGETG
jgi:beta-lactamase regulating signal transducer with metallopeptidase domain